MARKRLRTINTQTWEPALQNINRMERALVNMMAVSKLNSVTPSDVLDWMMPAEQLAVLRAASPFAEMSNSSFLSDGSRRIKFPFGAVTFYLDFIQIGIIPPNSKFIDIQPDAPKADDLRACVETIANIVSQYNKLRVILHEFKEKEVTPGAARYYWPTLQSLLPSDHVFFSSGTRFREVALTHVTIELLREAPEIVAKGLLCDPNTNGKDKMGRSLVRVRPGDTIGQQVFTLFSKGA